MSAPVAPPVVEPRRFPIAWALLALLLTYLVIQGAAVSLTPERRTDARNRPSAAEGTQYELQLRMAASMRALLETSGAWTRASQSQISDSLEESVAKLGRRRLTDPAASRMFAAMVTEQGSSLQAKDVAILAKGGPADRAFAEIYTKPKLTAEEARRLSAALPERPFVYQMARIHAAEKAGDKGLRQREVGAATAVKFAVLVMLFFGIFGIGALGWGLFIAGVATGRLKPLGFPQSPITPGDADRLALRAALLIGGYLTFSLSAAAFVRPSGPWYLRTEFWTLLVGATMVLYTFALARVPLFGKVIGLGAMGLRREQFLQNVGIGLLVFTMELPVALLAGVVGQRVFQNLPTPSHPATEQLLNSPDAGRVLGLLLLGVIVAPFWEEIAFRGAFLPALSRFMPVAGSIALSSLIFAAIHPTGIPAWPALAVVGAASAVASYYTKSLVPSVTMHFVHNLTLMISALLIGR